MEIDEITYDIDNVDIEEQMNITDIEEEIAAQEDELQRKEDEKAERELIKQSKKLTTKNLNDDLKYRTEVDRRHYVIQKDDIKYEIVVLHKISNEEYLFTSRDIKGDEWKTRKFKLSEIVQLK